MSLVYKRLATCDEFSSIGMTPQKGRQGHSVPAPIALSKNDDRDGTEGKSFQGSLNLSFKDDCHEDADDPLSRSLGRSRRRDSPGRPLTPLDKMLSRHDCFSSLETLEEVAEGGAFSLEAYLGQMKDKAAVDMDHFAGEGLLSISYGHSSGTPLAMPGGDNLEGSFVSAFTQTANLSLNVPPFMHQVMDSSGVFPTASRAPNKALFTISAKTSRILVANKYSCEVFGYAQGELVDCKIQKLFSEPYHSKQRALVEQHISSEGDTVLLSGKVMEAVHSDGSEFPVSVWMKGVKTADEPRVIVVIEPVARAVANFTLDCGSGEILRCDDNFTILFGYLYPEDVEGRKLIEFIPSVAIPDVAAVGSEEDLVEQQLTGRSKVNTVFPLTLSFKAKEFTASTPSSSSKVSEEANEEEPVDALLEGSMIVYSMLSGLISFLPNGMVHGSNEQFALMMLGYSKEEMNHMDILQLFPELHSHLESPAEEGESGDKQTEEDTPAESGEKQEEENTYGLCFCPELRALFHKKRSNSGAPERGISNQQNSFPLENEPCEIFTSEFLIYPESSEPQNWSPLTPCIRACGDIGTASGNGGGETQCANASTSSLPSPQTSFFHTVSERSFAAGLEGRLSPLPADRPPVMLTHGGCSDVAADRPAQDFGDSTVPQVESSAMKPDDVPGKEGYSVMGRLTYEEMAEAGLNPTHVENPAEQDFGVQQTTPPLPKKKKTAIECLIEDQDCRLSSTPLQDETSSSGRKIEGMESGVSSTSLDDLMTSFASEIGYTADEDSTDSRQSEAVASSSFSMREIQNSLPEPNTFAYLESFIIHEPGWKERGREFRLKAEQEERERQERKQQERDDEREERECLMQLQLELQEQRQQQQQQNGTSIDAESPVLLDSLPDGFYSGFARHKDGSLIPVWFQMRRISLADGSVVFCMWVSKDYDQEVYHPNPDPLNHSAHTPQDMRYDQSISPDLQIASFSAHRSRRKTTDRVHNVREATEGKYSDAYQGVQKLGEGAFGFVILAERKDSKDLDVVKFLRKSSVQSDSWFEDSRMGCIPMEIAIMVQISHQNIVQILEVFENEHYYQVVMVKHGEGMDLFTFIERCEVLTEGLASHMFRQMAAALRYLHRRNILHRDIKDENIILDSNFHIKLIDFGSATYMEPGRLFTTFCGTLEYCSPEVLLGNKYAGPELEMWSLGVTLYTLVFGENPFHDVEEIITGRLHPPFMASAGLMKMVLWLLHPDPQSRATLADLKVDKWTHQPFSLEDYTFEMVMTGVPELPGTKLAADQPPKPKPAVRCASAGMVA